MKKRAAGVNIPVFSLRTTKSLGTGEFYDLIPFIDWAKECGLSWIQLLPIHDTLIEESPYVILSTFSLHPLYLNVQELAPEFEDHYRPIIKALNLPRLDYQKTLFAKMELLRMIYLVRGEHDLKSEAFKKFFKKKANHLKPYAAFYVLRKRFGTSNFRKWGDCALYSELLVDQVCEDEEVKFHYFLQFHLDRQLRKVVNYAQSQGVILKGDLPMGVRPNSVEAWRFNEYFKWDFVMGAPPDFYNALGQNWGFPSYNWAEIKEEGYYWLKSRLKWMESYFEAIRIDHVLGYFRLWEIPKGVKSALLGAFCPAEGYAEDELLKAGLSDIEKLCQSGEDVIFLKRGGEYHPRIDVEHTAHFQSLTEKEQKIVLRLFDYYYKEKQEALWKKEGREKLKFMRDNTNLFLCAEDIGVIPHCVQEVLRELHILNLHVQRMPKSFDLVFEDPKNFPSTSVCTPSNHDTQPLRQWWEELDEEKRKIYYDSLLKMTGAPPKTLDQNLAEKIIQAHLDSKSQLAIFLLQDLFALNDDFVIPDPERERINDPADKKNRWDFRSHLYVEELLLAKSFNEKLKKMIEEANR